MKHTTKLTALLLAFAMMFALAACGGSGAPASTAQPASSEAAPASSAEAPASSEEAPAAEKKDSLTVAFTSEPPSLTTCDHDSLISVGLNMMNFNGLTKVNMETLEIELDLAESYTVENDVDWIFTLKKGVKFHDGSDLTADDVVASLEYAKSVPASVNYTKNWQAIEKIDDYTVKITTPEPYAGTLAALSFHFNFILPSELIESGHNFNEQPIGSGPYKLVEWVSGDHLTFEKFDDYFDEAHKPSIKTVRFNIIPEGASRAIALESGKVDFVWELNAADASAVKDNSKIYIDEVNSVDNVNLFMNQDKAPYDDVNFRRAIAAAINREDIIAGALNGYGMVNYACISQGYAETTNEDAIEYDLDKAKEYLAAWGGDPSTVTMEINVSNETRVNIATIIQNNLKPLGIDVKVNFLDTATYFERWDTGDYDALIASWSPPTAMMYVNRYGTDRRQQYPGSYNNPEMDVLLADMSKTLDDAERAEKIRNIIRIVNADIPQISLYQSVWLRAYDSNLKGVVCSGTGYAYYNDMYWGD